MQIQAEVNLTSSASHVIKININADNLANCIYKVAEQAGIYISADISLTQGKQCQAIKTSAGIESILAQLLTPFNLVAIAQTPTRYVVQKAQKTSGLKTLATAIVQADDLKDGSAADGYRSDEISSVGPWQGRTLKETPYSINVVPESLIKNLQATSADQIYKLNPVMQFTRPTTQNDNAEAAMRGFKNSTTARDGISRQKWNYSHGVLMEETASVEILTGLSGFIYGVGNIGGTINYVTKKPTAERLNSITLGNTSGSNVYIHGDFGGQFDEQGAFGYRVNLVSQDGENPYRTSKPET